MDNKGFTLIELIITIALLAVISIISFVSINGVIEENKVRDCENLESSIKSAAKEYVSDNRYNSDFVNSVGGDWEVDITAQKLIDNHNLSGDIVNPFDNNEVVTSSISVKVKLKDDYTADEVTVYKNSSLFSCSEENW